MWTEGSEHFGGCERVVEVYDFVLTALNFSLALSHDLFGVTLLCELLCYTYSALTCPTKIPKAHTYPTAPFSCLAGRLESTEMREMLEEATQRARIAEPVVAVHPVKMT